MESNEEPLPFPRIEGYRAVRHLDEGAEGSVWVVEDISTHDELVVKILGSGATREAAAAQLLGVRHEFLVESFGMIETSLGQGVLMEYCPAGSAANLVAVRGPLGVGEAITVVAPIAAALGFLHDQGLTHGDLSPRNIMFTAEGKPKLGDFGTCRSVGQSPGNYGTQGFCAPETSITPTTAGLEPARDVYALAACTWYLLTGRPPNATANRVPLGSMVPEVNDELARLLEQALGRDPEQRPSAEQFGQRIFVAGEPVPVELSEAIEHDALKHMLTTRQTPPSGRFRGGHRRRGNPTPADKELLKERRAQIKSQQKPVPRKLRLAFGGASPIQAGPRKETQGKGVPRARKVHGLKRGNLRIALALVAGALLVAAAAAGATLSSSGGEPVAATKQQSQAAASSAHQLRSAKPAPAATAESDRELMLVVAGLVALRDKGLMSGKPEEMKHIHAVGSPALAVDNAVMDKMRQAGLHLEGLTTKLSEVEVLPLDDKNQAVVEANSRQGSYRYVDDEGNSVLSVKKPDIQRIRMLLRVNDGVWRIWEVTAAR